MGKMIGVYGTISSGKSHFSKVIAKEFNYMYIDVDSLFKEYISNNSFYKDRLINFISRHNMEVDQFFTDGIYDVKKITNILFGIDYDKYLVDSFNTFNDPFISAMILNKIGNNENVIIEMAVLPIFSIKNLCDRVVHILTTSDTSDDITKMIKRNPHKDPAIIRNIFHYQMGWYDYTSPRIIIKNHEFLSDSELINQFNNN